MDRLPWAPWHWLVCIALGISWILDGIQVTSLGIIGDTLKEEDTLHISSKQVGLLGTIYILGAVTGALFFGIISDKYGRKRLFIITPAVYLTATFASAFSWNFESFASFIFFVGLGIGGEYSAMNSAINEFIPARVRGIVDLAINGSYWFGAAIGAAASILFLDRDIFPANIGWRLPAGIGSVLGIIIILTRMFLPESPRWLMTHNRLEEAEAIVSGIESKIERQKGIVLDVPRNTITINTSSKALNIFRVLHEIFRNYWSRAILSLALMVSQAFFYNAIFFTYALILTDFYGVASSHIGYYLIPFALGNFLGAVTIGALRLLFFEFLLLCCVVFHQKQDASLLSLLFSSFFSIKEKLISEGRIMLVSTGRLAPSSPSFYLASFSVETSVSLFFSLSLSLSFLLLLACCPSPLSSPVSQQ
ncbi:MFS transporter, variant 3 [Balamuthia mandrillaris]